MNSGFKKSESQKQGSRKTRHENRVQERRGSNSGFKKDEARIQGSQKARNYLKTGVKIGDV
jgi:hypothetical protein